ncbi:hypothetical protein CRG98_003411 [Punica granatum]|uniref:Uncharacterized protein n=1 Tax=Punica granatum TaxID=22663 RepID=A0A2I0L667_PUNGR|nr:hypothetical protein CRG98_003411 [Punica granatum]
MARTRFEYTWGHEDLTEPPQDEVGTSSRTLSSSGITTLVELTSIRVERDRLRREIIEKDEEPTNQR